MESDGPDGGQDRTDPAAPLARPDPAPCHDVRQGKEQLVVGALVAILEPVSNAGLARELEEVVAVSSHDGVVLLDDKPGIGPAGGDVLDERSEACGAGGQIGR